METMFRERLAKIVGELESIEVQGAGVARLERRRRELGLVGNRAAFLKMGTEMLKAATTADAEPNAAAKVPNARLTGLFCPSSDASIDDVQISDQMTPACPVESGRSRYLKAFVPTVLVSLFVSFFALFGAQTLMNQAAEAFIIPTYVSTLEAGMPEVPVVATHAAAAPAADAAAADTETQAVEQVAGK